MLNLLGDHSCKLDNKSRLLFPARLRKQLEEVLHHGLIVHRNLFVPCLTLYPKPEWDKIQQDFAKLNRHNRVHAEYIRRFLNGAILLELDSAGRLMIPSDLLQYAQVDLKQNNEVVLKGLFEKMELWSKANHDQMVNNDNSDFESMADEVTRFLEQKG